MKEIGLIGYGNFGKFIHENLSEYFSFHIYDINQSNRDIVFSNLKTCLSKEIIIISIPVQYIEDFLINNSNLFNKTSLVLDVSSVKIKPLQLMDRYLPKDIGIIGTHPLFGPNSFPKSEDGDNKKFKIALCPYRNTDWAHTADFLADKLGLDVIIKTPEEHDREMAYIQGLSHLIAKAMNEMDIKEMNLKTRSYEYLLKMYQMLKNDTDDLFMTIENENPFAEEARNQFIKQLNKINDNIRKQP